MVHIGFKVALEIGLSTENVDGLMQSVRLNCSN